MRAMPSPWCRIDGHSPRPIVEIGEDGDWHIVARCTWREVRDKLGQAVDVVVWTNRDGRRGGKAFVATITLDVDHSQPDWPSTVRLIGATPLLPA